MATSTFERKIEITNPEYAKKLMALMEDRRPVKPLSDRPYTDEERERSVALFKQCLSRSGKLSSSPLQWGFFFSLKHKKGPSTGP